MAEVFSKVFISGSGAVLAEADKIRSAWKTYPDSASLAAVPFTIVGNGQIAYVRDTGEFYIATVIPASGGRGGTPAQEYWTLLNLSGSFSGSFEGDGSQLTGIASSLYLTGSVGNDIINLKDDALTLTGSAGGIIVTVTNNKATFTIASPATISGSFTGDGSGLTGVGGVPGGTLNQLQYNSGSSFGGAEIYYISSSQNVGLGITNPSARLHVDGDVIVTGAITAEEFYTTFVSSSVLYQSGSTKFGNSADDIHQFTGSVNILGAVKATNYSGSFSGSFQGDGSNLTGIASTLALSGSTGNDLVNLKTDALTLTGSVKNIDVAVTNNKATFSVSNDLTLSNVNLTGSFKGAFEGTFSGSIDAVITNALTASYVLNAVSASHALQANNATSASYALIASNAISASYSTTASYVPGYVRDSGGQTNEVAIWNSTDQISGSQGFYVSQSYNGAVSTFLDGYYYSQNNGGFVALSTADVSGSRSTMGMYNPGTGTAIIYAGSGSGVTTGAIKIATDILDQAYAIGTNISPNKANTLRIEPTVELLNGITGSFSGSFYGQFVGLITSASYAVYAVNAATASYVLNAVSASYAATASYVRNAVSASYATYAKTSATASYFTGSHLDFTPLTNGSAPAHRAGRVWYDADNGALAVYNNEADITLQVGQEFYVRVFNPSSSIANGTPVYISGSQGDYPYIWPATAEDHTTGAHFDNHILGLATHDIEASSAGYVTRQGIVRNIDTTAFAAGDELFLQTGSAGLRNTPPPFPYDVVQVGFVIRSQANGFVFVEPKEPVHFSNISGLSGSGAAQNHDLWVFDSSNNAWYNTHSGLELSGSFSGSFYGPLAGTATTASYVRNAVSASYTTYAATAGTATSASYATYAASAATASFVSGYAQGTGATNQVAIWKTANTVSGSNWLTVTSSFNGSGIPAVLMNGNYYSYAQTATGGNGYVAFSGSAATASIMGLNVSQHEGQLYSANAGVVKSAIRLSTIYTDAYTIGRFLTPGTDNLLRIAPDVEILGAVTASTFVGNLIGTASYATKAESVGILNQNVTINGGLTVYGTASFVNVTSSRLDVDYAWISVNVFEPAERFAGLRVYDSGSESHMATASLAWDSTRNHWVYQNSSGSTYSGGGLMSGPRNTGSFGEETYPTYNTILRGQGGDHLYDANITDNNTVVSVKIPLQITGSVEATGNFSGSFIGDGSGLSGVSANPAGADKSVQFRSGSVTAGAQDFTYDHTTARVGIGTTPATKLDVNGSALVRSGISLSATTTTLSPGELWFPTGGTIGISGTGGSLNILTDGQSETLNINGSVGIGTTSPTEKLHVAGGGSGNIRLDSGGTYYGSNVQAISSTGLKIGNDDFSGYAFFSDGGNVGIGTATPNSKLHVHGTSYFFDQSIFSDKVGIGTTAPAVGLHVYNTTQGRIAIETSGSRRFDIIGDGDGLAFRDQTAAAIRMLINTSGAVKLNTYGSGTNTGTATKTLAVDSSGNVIELDVSSNGTGVANEVAFWKDTDTVSGSQDFTWNGTTLTINGILEANEKSFVIDHPTQPGKKLVYGVLEGPEHAVYCRGKISGEVIELPEEWTGLVHEDSITVQLTSIGKHQNLYVVDIRDNKVFIKNGDLLTSKINAYYYIQATRKDTKPLQTVRDK